MYTHTWSIISMDYDAGTGRVHTVHWQLVSVSGVHTVRRYGALSLDLTDPITVPYNDLTTEVVEGWVDTAITKSSIQTLAEAKLDDLTTPPLSSGIPW